MAKFIAMDDNGNAWQGDSLEEVYNSAKEDCDARFDDLEFFEATKLAVEIKIIKKEVVQKMPTKKVI